MDKDSSVEKVGAFVKGLGKDLAQYHSNFVDNQIDEDIISTSTNAQLNDLLFDIGISSTLHRTKFVCQYKKATNGSSASREVENKASVEKVGEFVKGLDKDL